MARLAWIFITLLCIAPAFAYRLIDSETFETYTNWAQGGTTTSFFAESADKWNCTDSAYYLTACVNPFGGDDYALALGQLGGFNIGVDGNNNYMLTYALNGDCMDGDSNPDYIKVQLDWLHTNGSNLSQFTGGSRHIMQYKLKVLNTATGMNACGSTGLSYYGGIFTLNVLSFNGSNEYIGSRMGNLICSAPNSTDVCFNSLKTLYSSGTSRMLPSTGTACIVDDGNWHDVKVIIKVNSTYHLTNWTTYIDDIACESRAPNSAKSATTKIFATASTPFRVEATGNYSIYVDDLALFEANESDNFTGIALDYPECDDGIDNDGDGFIDYGGDPSCTNVVDDTEAPFDYSSTTCDSYTPPTYLKESFNTYLNGCGWFTTHNILPVNGALNVSSSQTPYVQSKALSADLTSSMSRYATLKYDLRVASVATDNFIDIRLYDVDYVNFWIFYLGGSPLTIYTTKAGVDTVVTTISYNTTYTFKVIVDLQTRTYDAYLNSSQIANDYQFMDSYAAIDDLYFFKLASTESSFQLDNILIYSSDSTGAILSSSNPITQVDNGTQMCGLFYKTTSSCSVDSDCATNDCLPTGRCNRFDMGYCDEKGMVRGNKCILGAVVGCAAKNTTDIILDNLLYVLAFAIILIAVAYLIIVTRR